MGSRGDRRLFCSHGSPPSNPRLPIADCRLPRSALSLRHRDGHPIELVADADLAGEARGRPDVEGEVEHVLLHRLGLTHDLLERFVDIDVAGGAGAGAAAFGLDAGYTVAD